jgi:molybdopterin molybdotransferase
VVALEPNDLRQDYLRARHVEGFQGRRVAVAARQDSSMLATFAGADALVVRPPHDPARAPSSIMNAIELSEALDNLR